MCIYVPYIIMYPVGDGLAKRRGPTLKTRIGFTRMQGRRQHFFFVKVPFQRRNNKKKCYHRNEFIIRVSHDDSSNYKNEAMVTNIA